MFDREKPKEIIKREQVENLEDFQELMCKDERGPGGHL